MIICIVLYILFQSLSVSVLKKTVLQLYNFLIDNTLRLNELFLYLFFAWSVVKAITQL